MPGRDEDALAAEGGERESPAERFTRIEDGLRGDVDLAEPLVGIDRRTGCGRHELQDVDERESVLQPCQPELLVGIALQQESRVPADVIEGMGGHTGDPADLQRARELVTCVGPRDPPIVQSRETPGVRFDNVHPFQGRGASMQLKGAVAVVTGASSGIGEAVAVGLAQRGARVVLAARRKERLDVLADRIERAGGTALAIRCDVTDREQLASLPTVVNEAFGPCDILVNNAGIPGGGEFVKLTYEQIERVVDVNVLGVMYGTRAFLPGMLKRGRGHIVNVASLAGRFTTPGAAVYGATKHAVVAFSESLYYEVEQRGVLVTAVNPGFVVTEGFPMEDMNPRLLLSLERVAGAVVRVVRDDIAPELSVPRYLSPLQAFRVLTPPLYRWGVRRARDMGLKGTKTPDG
jgi:short-subunit dehydrogenase